MIVQLANSGAPLAGNALANTALANTAPANTAPPIAAPTSDAAADAAAWARIDRALKNTRKWLWVFVVLFIAAAAIVLLPVASLAEGRPPGASPMPTWERVFVIVMISLLSAWAIAAACCAVGLTRWALGNRRESRISDYASLVPALERQRLAWMAGAIAIGFGAAYFTVINILALVEAV